MKLLWLSAVASPALLIGLTTIPAEAKPWDTTLPTVEDTRGVKPNYQKIGAFGRRSGRRISRNVGFEFEGSSRRNRTTLNTVSYEGDCPGETTTVKKARFVSNRVRPGRRRRVKIVNVTPGLRTRPYTDREYHRGARSEATVVEFGNRHTLKRLRVVPGRNVFAYRITERNRIIDQGRFVSFIRQNRRRVTRNAKWYEDEVCANSSVALSSCADVRFRRQYRCSTGKVLKTQWNNRSRYYRTVLANRSRRDVNVYLDGDWYRMEPGERIRLRRRKSFKLRYKTGNRTRTSWITPGKRLQFRRRKDSRQIYLTDHTYRNRDGRRYGKYRRDDRRYRDRRYQDWKRGDWKRDRWQKNDRYYDERNQRWEDDRGDIYYD